MFIREHAKQNVYGVNKIDGYTKMSITCLRTLVYLNNIDLNEKRQNLCCGDHGRPQTLFRREWGKSNLKNELRVTIKLPASTRACSGGPIVL